jgi:hypothetical protein
MAQRPVTWSLPQAHEVIREVGLGAVPTVGAFGPPSSAAINCP